MKLVVAWRSASSCFVSTLVDVITLIELGHCYFSSGVQTNSLKHSWFFQDNTNPLFAEPKF